MQNSIIFNDDFGFSLRNFFVSVINILAHLSLGNPKMPELIAGIDKLSNYASDARKSEFLTASFSFLSSSPSPSSAQLRELLLYMKVCQKM